MTSLQDFRQKAIDAHRWVSMKPEAVGERTILDHEIDLQQFLQKIPSQHYDWVIEKYKKMFNKWLSAKSNCISAFITGPSNFPTKRAEKFNKYEHSAYNDFTSWKAHIVKKLNRKEKLSLDAEYEKTMQEIDDATEFQELMKKANKIIRSKSLEIDEKEKELYSIGIEKDEIRQLFKGGWWGIGYAPFSLTNNNARIKGMIEKSEKLKIRIESRGQESLTVDCGFYTYIENVELDRFQIFFACIPSAEIRNLLKKNGFKWSPNNGCWQHFLNSGKRNYNYYIKDNIKL